MGVVDGNGLLVVSVVIDIVDEVLVETIKKGFSIFFVNLYKPVFIEAVEEIWLLIVVIGELDIEDEVLLETIEKKGTYN